MNTNDIEIYNDIINLPHHVSGCYPHMSMADRAAQFSPFAALTGYGEAIKDTAKKNEDSYENSNLYYIDGGVHENEFPNP